MLTDLGQEKFFVVGIGASAGGLEALEEFFNVMPVDSGLAFIVIVHLAPTHVSLLPELLQRRTAMPTKQITENLLVEPNTLYVIPPNHNLSIQEGRLQLTPLDIPRPSHLPIDYFFASLAKDQGDKAIAIILSGTGSDGSQGLREIKAEAGLVIAQDENSAKYTGMPKSAFETGLVDYVLTPAEMPSKLLQFCNFPHNVILSNEQQNLMDGVLQKILLIIRNQIGNDFSQYKTNTLYRRIERRMQLHQIEKMVDYLAFLQANNQEVAALAKELLIGVTRFFRDPEAFELLKNKYLPELLTQKPNAYTMRIWVPGCSSGEEAYSIAILLQECLDHFNQHINVQIFGTDIDENAIEIARRGFYPNNITNHINHSRLNRFFIKEENGYRIKKSIREQLVFAVQNVTKDPPFTKLDMISCRNLLIYFSAELQKKILPIYHYGLKPSGILFLGSSETTGASSDYFSILDRKWKLFSRIELANGLTNILHRYETVDSHPQPDAHNTSIMQKSEELSLLQIVEAILKRSAIPPCVVIDEQYNILYVHGRLGGFIAPAQGKITVNILDMINSGLKTELAAALRKVRLSKNTVQNKPCKCQTEQGNVSVVITVSPILEHSLIKGLLMVVFEEFLPATVIAHKQAFVASSAITKTQEELQNELALTKQNLQTSIEELETANEELKSTNEELQSTNEELQSTNEELETSKEELQSLNEEAVTVNVELQSRIEDYQIVNDDLKNLFDSIQVATVFLDTKLCIRRFTPKAKQIIPLTATDIGRPISHLSCNLQQANLTELSQQVLKTLVKLETKLYDNQGSCYFMRIQPYRTNRNVIDGVILSFEDISVRNNLELALIASEKRYKSLFSYSPMVIWEEDCSGLVLALQALRANGVSDLEDYLIKNPDELNRLLKTKRILEINSAALSLFKAFNKDDFMLALPELLIQQSKEPFKQQLQAIWQQQSRVNLAFNCLDAQGNVLKLTLTWIVPSELNTLNYNNVIAAVLAQI